MATYSVGTASRDYSTLSAALTDTDGEASPVFEIYDDSTFTERVSISGLTSTNITIKKAPSSGRPLFQPPSGTGHVFTIGEDDVTIEDIDVFQYSGAAASDENFRFLSGVVGFTARGVRGFGNRGTSQLDVAYAGNYPVGSAAKPIRFEFCEIREGNRGLIHAQHYSGSGDQYWEVIQCTLSGCIGDGIAWRANDAGTTIHIVAKNNIVIKCADAFDQSATGSGSVDTTGSTHNFDDDGSMPGQGAASPGSVTDSLTPPAGSWAIFAAIEPDPADDDLHLVDSDQSDVLDTGIGPASDSDIPTRDLDGVAISGTTCDPGCYQAVAAGGVSVNATGSGLNIAVADGDASLSRSVSATGAGASVTTAAGSAVPGRSVDAAGSAASVATAEGQAVPGRSVEQTGSGASLTAAEGQAVPARSVAASGSAVALSMAAGEATPETGGVEVTATGSGIGVSVAAGAATPARAAQAAGAGAGIAADAGQATLSRSVEATGSNAGIAAAAGDASVVPVVSVNATGSGIGIGVAAGNAALSRAVDQTGSNAGIATQAGDAVPARSVQATGSTGAIATAAGTATPTVGAVVADIRGITWKHLTDGRRTWTHVTREKRRWVWTGKPYPFPNRDHSEDFSLDFS